MNSNKLIPLSEILKKIDASKSNIIYLFKQDEELSKTFLVVKTITFKNGNKGKRYYIRYSFIKYYFNHIDRRCTEEDIKNYEALYYKYVKQEENKLEQNGKSISSDKELWKDMEIIDAKLSKASLKMIRFKEERKTTPYDRREISDIVYRHIYGKKRYLDVVQETLEAELE